MFYQGLREATRPHSWLSRWRTKILRATDAFSARRREGPYRFIQKRLRTSVVALKSGPAAEKSKDQLRRDFQGCSIFDFCNNIDPQRTSFRLWPALASALVANNWTVELTGVITSRSQRRVAPGRRPQWGRTRAKGGPTISIVVSSLLLHHAALVI